MIQSEILSDTLSNMVLYPEAAVETAKNPNVWDICVDTYYLLPLLALLLLWAIYMVIERGVIVGKAARFDPLFLQRIKDYIHDGETESAENLCRKVSSPSGRMVLKGLEMIGKPMTEIATTMKLVADTERGNLKKNFCIMPFIAAASPVIGAAALAFTFAHVYGSNMPQQNAEPTLFAGFVTLIAGLIVCFLALAFVQFLKSRFNKLDLTLTTTVARFLDILNEPAA